MAQFGLPKRDRQKVEDAIRAYLDFFKPDFVDMTYVEEGPGYGHLYGDLEPVALGEAVSFTPVWTIFGAYDLIPVWTKTKRKRLGSWTKDQLKRFGLPYGNEVQWLVLKLSYDDATTLILTPSLIRAVSVMAQDVVPDFVRHMDGKSPASYDYPLEDFIYDYPDD